MQSVTCDGRAHPRRGVRGRDRRVLRAATARSSPTRSATLPVDRRPARQGDVRARARDDRRRSAARREHPPGRRRRTGEGRGGLEPVPHDVRRRVVGPAARDHGRRARSTSTATRTSRSSARPRSRAPSCSACAARPATRSTTRRRTGSRPTRRVCSCPTVDVVSGVGYDRAASSRSRRGPVPRPRARRHEPLRARLRDARPPDAAALGAPRRDRRRRRGGDRLRARHRLPTCPRARLPTDDELHWIREVIDPHGLGEKEVPNP